MIVCLKKITTTKNTEAAWWGNVLESLDTAKSYPQPKPRLIIYFSFPLTNCVCFQVGEFFLSSNFFFNEKSAVKEYSRIFKNEAQGPKSHPVPPFSDNYNSIRESLSKKVMAEKPFSEKSPQKSGFWP
jgi:hypothetical protein